MATKRKYSHSQFDQVLAPSDDEEKDVLYSSKHARLQNETDDASEDDAYEPSEHEAEEEEEEEEAEEEEEEETKVEPVNTKKAATKRPVIVYDDEDVKPTAKKVIVKDSEGAKKTTKQIDLLKSEPKKGDNNNTNNNNNNNNNINNNDKNKKKKTSSSSLGDQFEKRKKAADKKKSDLDKRQKNNNELKRDLLRPSALKQVESCKELDKMNTQFSRSFYVNLYDKKEDKDVRQQMHFVLTSRPYLHFMGFPNRSAKKDEMTEDEIELYDAAVKRFDEETRPEHLCTMQLPDKRGKITASKNVMFDRHGTMREWTMAQARSLVKRYPDLVDTAMENNNRKPATLRQCLSLKTQDDKSIDWHSHIIPQCLYTILLKERTEKPNKAKRQKKNEPTSDDDEPKDTGDGDTKSEKTEPKQKKTSDGDAKPKGEQKQGDEDSVPVHTFSDTDINTLFVRTMTESLVKNAHADRAICNSVRVLMSKVVLQLKTGHMVLTEDELKWLFFGFMAFDRRGYPQYGSDVFSRPHTGGKALASTAQKQQRPGGKGVMAVKQDSPPTTTPTNVESESDDDDDSDTD